MHADMQPSPSDMDSGAWTGQDYTPGAAYGESPSLTFSLSDFIWLDLFDLVHLPTMEAPVKLFGRDRIKAARSHIPFCSGN